MTSCKCVRWACRLSSWTGDETILLRYIQKEEVDRCLQFVHRDDARRAIIGRLLIRRGLSHLLGVDWDKLKLSRSAKGKPLLLGYAPPFNISHDGDWVVFASSCSTHCGVDIMNIKRPNGIKNVPDYIKLMSRQFSSAELECLRNKQKDLEKLQLFYRYWCLKESYIKALGIGIHSKLSSLDFRIANPDEYLKNKEITKSTWLNGPESCSEFEFEESLLSNDYVVVVCTKKRENSMCKEALFSEIYVKQLIESAKNVSDVNTNFVTDKLKGMI